MAKWKPPSKQCWMTCHGDGSCGWPICCLPATGYHPAFVEYGRPVVDSKQFHWITVQFPSGHEHGAFWQIVPYTIAKPPASLISLTTIHKFLQIGRWCLGGDCLGSDSILGITEKGTLRRGSPSSTSIPQVTVTMDDSSGVYHRGLSLNHCSSSLLTTDEPPNIVAPVNPCST